MRKKSHQRFVVTRLRLLDEQYCLNQHRYLHQTCLDLGLQHELWPVSMEMTVVVHWLHTNFSLQDEIQKVLSSNDHIVVKRYLRDHIGSLQHKINDCGAQLNRLPSTNQWTCSSLDVLETRLNEFVHLYHIDLSKLINYRVDQFNDRVREQQIFRKLSACQLKAEQVGPITEYHCNSSLSSSSSVASVSKDSSVVGNSRTGVGNIQTAGHVSATYLLSTITEIIRIGHNQTGTRSVRT